MILGGVLMALTVAATPKVALAEACPSSGFLGFKPWYAGLECDSNGGIMAPSGGNANGSTGVSESALKSYFWKIVLNISFDLSLAIGIIGMAMIIYGGYMYITSSGDPGKAMKGQKTLARAIIGMIIAVSASVVINTVTAFQGFGEKTADVASILKEAFSWAFTAAGIVAVGFIIKAGIEYMVSSGDPGKTAKATKGIIFSIVGLLIVIAAGAITSFVLDKVGA